MSVSGGKWIPDKENVDALVSRIESGGYRGNVEGETCLERKKKCCGEAYRRRVG